jgi:HlyD family secretion protein
MRSGALLLLMVSGLHGCSTRDAAATAVGTLEYTEVAIAPLTLARVEDVRVAEGAVVRAGDTVVVLRQPTMDAAIRQGDARVRASTAALRDLEAGARPAELARAEAELAAAEADVTRTRADLARLAPLADRGTVSRAQLDAATAAASIATARRSAALSALQLLREGARRERVRAAAADRAGADAAIDVMRAAERDLVLIAPVSGVVTSRHVEVGEVLAPGSSALMIGETRTPWARLYVNQSVLPQLRVGATLDGRIDALPDRVFRGRIVSIATRAEFTPRVALTERERADLQFAVKVAFDDSTGALKAGVPIVVTLPVAP